MSLSIPHIPLPTPIFYALCLALSILVTTAIGQVIAPNNFLTVHNYCQDVFQGFNSTKWYAGEYSMHEMERIMDCYKKIQAR